MDIEIGDSFFPIGHAHPHLRVVISYPEKDSEKVLLVNFTGHEGEYRDDSCILEIGEHPFITKRTSICYKDASFATVGQLNKLLKLRKIEKREPVSSAVLTKILEGADVTEFLTNKYKRLLSAQGLGD